MVIVKTAYYGPTNRAGARVRTNGGRSTKNVNRAWDHGLTDVENHKGALLAFVTANGILPAQWQGGAQEDGTYIWMAAPTHVFGTL